MIFFIINNTNYSNNTNLLHKPIIGVKKVLPIIGHGGSRNPKYLTINYYVTLRSKNV